MHLINCVVRQCIYFSSKLLLVSFFTKKKIKTEEKIHNSKEKINVLLVVFSITKYKHYLQDK